MTSAEWETLMLVLAIVWIGGVATVAWEWFWEAP